MALEWYVGFDKMTAKERFNNQNARNMIKYASKCITFALDNYQSVILNRGRVLVIINKVKRNKAYEKN